MKPKKLRGRPKGTVIPTDRKTLDAVADLILREPTLRPTTAIKRVVPDWTDSIVHRLMGKWRKAHEALMAEARQRREAREARANSAKAVPVGRATAYLLADIRRIYDSPAVRTVYAIANSSAVKTAREMMNSPEMQTAQAIMNSPAMRLARQIHDSPTARMMHALQYSPTMQMWKAFESHPLAQLAKAQQRLRRV